MGSTLNINRTPIRFNNTDSRFTSVSIGGNAGIALNWQDLIEFTPKYTITSNRSYYTIDAFTERNIVQQVLQGEFIVTDAQEAGMGNQSLLSPPE
jgi:hypothetical protein